MNLIMQTGVGAFRRKKGNERTGIIRYDLLTREKGIGKQQDLILSG